MLMKLICSGSSNQSQVFHDYPDCRHGASEASLLVSPLVVAGIVIGLVLFLSCVTIIIGSFRKDSRLHNPHLRASYAPDGVSYGGSQGELRSACLEDFPTTFDLESYTEALSQAMYPDSPPRYDECMGPGATQMYPPTDDPPPYSLTDPWETGCDPGWEEPPHLVVTDEQAETSAGASWFSSESDANCPIRLQDLRQQPIASISLSALPLEAAPPYDSLVEQQNQPLPLMPLDLFKHQSDESVCSPQQPESHPIL
ncbi:protein BEAN1 [Aplochiton taeniatus]